MEHGLKDIAFYVQKHITPRAVCYDFPLVSYKPLGSPRICETRRRRFSNRIPYQLLYRPDIALPISKHYQMALSSRVCQFRWFLISVWYRMTEIKISFINILLYDIHWSLLRAKSYCARWCQGIHYSDVIWESWHLKSQTTWQFVQQLVQIDIKDI